MFLKNREDIEQYQIFYHRRQLVYITINVTRIKEKYWFFVVCFDSKNRCMVLVH